jgi:hypothetical protein
MILGRLSSHGLQRGEQAGQHRERIAPPGAARRDLPRERAADPAGRGLICAGGGDLQVLRSAALEDVHGTLTR